jgi:hypothetical protein
MEKGPEAIDANFKAIAPVLTAGKFVKNVTGTWVNGYSGGAPVAHVFDIGNGAQLVAVDSAPNNPAIAPWSTTKLCAFVGLPKPDITIGTRITILGLATVFCAVEDDGNLTMVHGDGDISANQHMQIQYAYISKGV